MAPVKRWLIGGGVVCAALAVAYLPPRGARAGRRLPVFMAQFRQGTPARLRAQDLAEQWRGAQGALELLLQRRALQAAVATRNPYVTFSEPARVSPDAARMVDSALQRAWRRLGLSDTKVRVAVVVDLDRSVGRGDDEPSVESGMAAYLAPDSTDRTTCIAFLPAGRYWTRMLAASAEPLRAELMTQLLASGLGPCAFYAAFGTPGKPVRRWLAARNWELALTLDPGRERSPSFLSGGERRFPWYWDVVYGLPTETVACLAGRADGCRGAVTFGASDEGIIPTPDVIRTDRRWWRPQRLIAAQRYLADVQREVGRDRFLTFWTSALPVDTALSAALKRPVGAWTAEWQRQFAMPVRLGAAPPWGAAVLSLFLGIGALTIVVLTASRRQVR